MGEERKDIYIIRKRIKQKARRGNKLLGQIL